MIKAICEEINSAISVKKVGDIPDLSVDILMVEVSQPKIKILMTDGLSAKEQPVDKEDFQKFKRIELYFCLPEYWDIDKNSWPIEWLNRLAQVPSKNNTWFGPGDTIPAGNPPLFFLDKLLANHFMLTEPIRALSFFQAPNWSSHEIGFLGIIPINQEEIDYKLRNSATVLLQRLEKKGYDELVDPFRQPVCRKRILGMF